MNAGQATIEWLYNDQLQVDDEWAVRTPDGFRWWAYRNAQTVEVVGADHSDPDEETGYFIAVRTELLRDLELTERSLAFLNGAFLQAPSMSGPVYDPEAGTLALCSLARTHGEIAGWMERWLSMAAVLQLGEAHFAAPQLAAMLGADLAVSGHPESGMRPAPDELLGVIPQVVVSQGAEASRWTDAEFEQAFGEDADADVSFPPGLDGAAFGAAVSGGGDGERVLCRLRADLTHPGFGAGLMLVQQFPGAARSDSDGVRLALALNEYELTQQPLGYGFGSYSWQGEALHFSAFFPNAMHHVIGLVNLFNSCRARALGIERARAAVGGG